MEAVVLMLVVAIVSGGLAAVLVNRDLGAAGGRRHGEFLSRTKHQAAEGLINNPLSFHTVVDPDTVAAKITAEIAPCRRAGSRDELYLATAEPTGDGSSFVLLYRADGGQGKIMETAVLLKASGRGTSGTVRMETWPTVDGVIDTAAVNTAWSVRDGVRRVIARLDAAAEFSGRN